MSREQTYLMDTEYYSIEKLHKFKHNISNLTQQIYVLPIFRRKFIQRTLHTQI